MKVFEVVLCFKHFQHLYHCNYLIFKGVEVLKRKTHFHYNARAKKSFFMDELPVVEFTIKVRLATPEDLKKDSRTLNYGQPFWLRSMFTGKFQNQPMKINEDTDPKDLADWLRLGMIYVPVKWSEAKFIPAEDVR